jgi:hypothetical protein
MTWTCSRCGYPKEINGCIPGWYCYGDKKFAFIAQCVECGLVGWHDISECKKLSKMRAAVDRRY